MIPLEIITMAGGSLVGFVFRYMAERAKDRQEQFKMYMQASDQYEKSKKEASQREKNDYGRWVRRLIVVSLLFGVIIAPFILTILGKSSIVEVDIVKPSYFFGMFGGGTEKAFVELSSYFVTPEIRQSLLAVVGYYFGSATARN
jgi:hypothetical protein